MLSADRPQATEPPIAVERVSGFPADLDILAAAAPACRGFLRASWFAAAADRGETLIARRACGQPILAIPTMPTGPALLGLRVVPGSYWPFRSILVAPCASEVELARALSAKTARTALTPIWRLGPVYADDPALSRIKHAAGRAGWTVLQRPVGRTWLFDLSGEGWPRRTTRRRLANYEKQLATMGAVRIDHVSGDGWSAAVLATLAAIEENSWIAKTTDRSGAKFLADDRRARWLRMFDDPALAAAASATILTVGETPAAFSFDLRAGTTQYAIASSYDERFTAFSAGKIVTRHQLERARAEGVTLVDLGAGDGGYKQEMGARAGSDILDLLIVRSRPAAALLKLRWGAESPIGREGYRAGAAERRWEFDGVKPWLAAGAIAAAAFALTE